MEVKNDYFDNILIIWLVILSICLVGIFTYALGLTTRYTVLENTCNAQMEIITDLKDQIDEELYSLDTEVDSLEYELNILENEFNEYWEVKNTLQEELEFYYEN